MVRRVCVHPRLDIALGGTVRAPRLGALPAQGDAEERARGERLLPQTRQRGLRNRNRRVRCARRKRPEEGGQRPNRAELLLATDGQTPSGKAEEQASKKEARLRFAEQTGLCHRGPVRYPRAFSSRRRAARADM